MGSPQKTTATGTQFHTLVRVATSAEGPRTDEIWEVSYRENSFTNEHRSPILSFASLANTDQKIGTGKKH